MRIACGWLAALIVLMGAPVAAQAAGPAPGTSIVLRVATPEYTLDAHGLRVQGYAVHDAAGAPALPVWSTVVELPAEGAWSLSYTSRNVQMLRVPAPLPAVPAPQVTFDRPLSTEEIAAQVLAAPLVEQPDPAIYGVDAFYPSAPVQAGPEQWQRGRRLLVVRVFPFQYNPHAGQVRYHPEVEVVVTTSVVTTKDAPPLGSDDFSRPLGSDDFSRPLGSDDFSRPLGSDDFSRPLGSDDFSRSALRVYTGPRGLYRLTAADLAGLGVPVADIDPATIAMTYLDAPIDILVTGASDGRFDPGDLIIFYAEPYQGRYMTANVYRLSYGATAGQRMATRRVAFTGDEPLITTITQTAHIEFDRSYYSTYPLPRDADHWFDNPLYANAAAPVAAVTYDLTLDDPVFAGAATLRARLHGGVAQAATPDQSVALRVNGRALGLFQWQGSTLHLATAAFPASWLDAPAPTVTLEAALSQLPGLPYYWVSPDWLQVRYPARPDAEGDHIVIEGFAAREPRMRMEVTGFTEAAVRAVDVRDPRRPVVLESLTTTPAGLTVTARLWDAWPADAPPPAYVLNTDAGLRAPLAVEVDTPSAWRAPDHQADYIAVVPRPLWDAVQPLLDHRAAEGLRVAKVDVQDIYDEFSAGRVDPEAIRSFLAYAYRHWNAGAQPPRYVLLVGDGHYDFKNAAGSNLPNLIPPYLLPIDPWIGETAADNRYASVDGPDDFLPDMHLGRIPAQSPADVAAVVNKIIAYETAAAPGPWQRQTVFVADDYANRDGNFHGLSDLARLQVPPSSYTSETIYYRSSPALDTGAEMRAAIQRAFDAGALYLQWFGHASQFRWGSVSFFDVLGPPALAPTAALPLTAHYGCWSGYFINIRGSLQYGNSPQSLGEVLLLTPGRGAIADLSPSGLHVGPALAALNQGLVQALFRDRIGRVGPAVDAARAYYAAHAEAWPDIVDTSILFADPALQLRLPSPNTYLPLITQGGR